MKNRFTAYGAALAVAASLVLTNASSASATTARAVTIAPVTKRLEASASSAAFGVLPQGRSIKVYEVKTNGGYYTACGKRSNDWALITLGPLPLWVANTCLQYY